MSPSRLHQDLRHTAFAPLDTAGRAETVERRLAEAIAFGLIAPGDQLPSEAELSRQFGVATVTLREALAALRERGLIETRRGRGGGTFVRARIDDPAFHLSSASLDGLRDLGDYAAAIAGQAAALAAARRLEADLERLAGHIESLATAQTMIECQLADRRFHVEISACAQSTRLTSEEISLQGELGPLIAVTGLLRGRSRHDRRPAQRDPRGDPSPGRDAGARNGRAARSPPDRELPRPPHRARGATVRPPGAVGVARGRRPRARSPGRDPGRGVRIDRRDT